MSFGHGVLSHVAVSEMRVQLDSEKNGFTPPQTHFSTPSLPPLLSQVHVRLGSRGQICEGSLHCIFRLIAPHPPVLDAPEKRDWPCEIVASQSQRRRWLSHWHRLLEFCGQGLL